MAIRNDILLVTDSRYELDNIQDLLKSEYGLILKTPLEEEAIRLFKKHHPKLLILAYEDVESAEAFYLTIYEKDPAIHEAVHKTLLLCRGQQSDLAYELCFNGIMDDYVADRPLFDPHRLLLSVRNAIDSHDSEQKAVWFMRQIEKSQNDLHELYLFIQNHLATIKNTSVAVDSQFGNYVSRLKNDLRELEKQASPLFGLDEDFEDAKTEFVEAITELETNTIDKPSQTVKQSITKLADDTNQLDQDIKTFISAMGKKQESDVEDDKIHVLIIDDDPMYLSIIEAMLESEPLVIKTETDGPSALKAIEKSRPDIILLDYLMPDMDGLTVLKKLKLEPQSRAIPVIMLTGVASREIVASCIKYGAAEYIIKPGDREQLIAKINLLSSKC